MVQRHNALVREPDVPPTQLGVFVVKQTSGHCLRKASTRDSDVKAPAGTQRIVLKRDDQACELRRKQGAVEYLQRRRHYKDQLVRANKADKRLTSGVLRADKLPRDLIVSRCFKFFVGSIDPRVRKFALDLFDLLLNPDEFGIVRI